MACQIHLHKVHSIRSHIITAKVNTCVQGEHKTCHTFRYCMKCMFAICSWIPLDIMMKKLIKFQVTSISALHGRYFMV